MIKYNVLQPNTLYLTYTHGSNSLSVTKMNHQMEKTTNKQKLVINYTLEFFLKFPGFDIKNTNWCLLLPFSPIFFSSFSLNRYDNAFSN